MHAPLHIDMDENKDRSALDDDIINEYRGTPARGREKADGEVNADGVENGDNAHDETAERGDAAPVKKSRRGMARHLYPCPHCGEQILDSFTTCPKCGGEVTPRGYHVDERKRKKVVRIFEIVGAVVSVVTVILVAVLTNI